MSAPERIFLSPADAEKSGGKYGHPNLDLVCVGDPSVEYVRADLLATVTTERDAALAEVARLRAAITLIERIYYREGEAAQKRAAQMNCVARDAHNGTSLVWAERLFSRSALGQTGEGRDDG